MISRRARSSFVCLRCRSTLAGSASKRLVSSVYRDAPKRLYSDAVAPDQRIANPIPKDSHHGTTQEEGAENQSESLKPPSHPVEARDSKRPWYSKPPRRNPEIYRSRGQRVRPKEEALSVDILGKPAHAIVMKEVGSSRRPRRTNQTEVEADSPQRVDVSAFLDRQTRPPASDEVFQHIAELRPDSTRPILHREFSSIVDTLVSGFTMPQLKAYIARFSPEDGRSEATPDMFDKPWVREWRAWVAGVPDVSKTPRPLQFGYMLDSMTPKQRLAVRVLRECWGVSTQEVENGTGYIDIGLRSLEFSLLLFGNGKFLENISRSFLGPGKQIELIRPTKTVRIVAPRTLAETILKELNSLLGKVESRTFGTELLTLKDLPFSWLEEVGKITNTLLRYDDLKNKVHVYWIPFAEPSRGHEDLGDVVFRLLLSASGKDAPSRMVTIPKDAATGGRYVEDHYNNDKWSWKDRSARWGRWVLPASKTAEPLEKEKLDSMLLTALDGFVTDQDVSPPPDPIHLSPATGWPEELQSSISAVFGHILHRLHYQMPDPLQLATKPMLTPVIPPLSTLAFPETADQQPAVPATSTILMRFLPDATRDPALLSSAPPLELRLAASDTQVLGISSLRAIAATSTLDLLHPAGPVDARLTRTTFHELAGPSLADSPRIAGPLAAFLDAADLRPAAGRLVTLPRLRGLVVSGQDAVDYLFAGLEVRRAVATPFAGWPLMYTTVEAGRAGGRRAELVLGGLPVVDAGAGVHAGVETAQDGTTDKETHGAAAYVATLSRILHGHSFSWFGARS